jgi:DNA-binding NarL/FixJ family response regulator
MTTVLVAGGRGHPAGAVAAMLRDDESLTVCACVASLAETRDACWPDAPDVALLAPRLADGSGADACEALRRDAPATRRVLLLDAPREPAVLSAFEAGAAGVVLAHDVGPELLRQAVHAVAAGGVYLDPRVAGRIVGLALRSRPRRGPFGLTGAELCVLERLPAGMSNREIARDLGVAESTVKTHVSAILRKLEVSDRAQAAARARREGIAR